MSYVIKTQKFEGPLEVLLDFIEKQKLEITEISLSQVADQYLEYLQKLEVINPEILAEFLVIASRLILIKSRALLPNLEISSEEQAGIEELQQRLLELKRFKEAGKLLGKMAKQNNAIFSREFLQNQISFFYPPQNLSANDLKKSFEKILQLLPKKELLPQEKIKEIISLEDTILKLKERISKSFNENFAGLIKKSNSKTEIIVTFLALLELIKQKFINVNQQDLFENIKIFKT